MWGSDTVQILAGEGGRVIKIAGKCLPSETGLKFAETCHTTKFPLIPSSVYTVRGIEPGDKTGLRLSTHTLHLELHCVVL